MEALTLIQDLAVVMAVAAVITLVFHRLRLPVVLGYILAGLVIGPHTPPYPLVRDLHSIHTLSELGIVFLLFAIGLEFSITRLMKVGRVAVIAASLEIFLMIAIGYALGRAFGWSFMDSVFLGAILSISSTTIIAKVLLEMKIINESFAQVILGILIIEDLLAIILIAMLSGLAASGSLTFAAAGYAFLKVVAFVCAFMVVGILTIPALLRYLDKKGLEENLVISVLGICFAGALFATKSGFSVALGAFLAGAIIAETRQAKNVIHRFEPIRDMFTAVFFVAVGMMIKPGVLLEFWAPILIIAAVTILGKVFSCSLAAFLSGYPSTTSLMVGLGLAQIGEFSFIIANLGDSAKVTSHFLYPIAVSVSAITTLTTPFLMGHSAALIRAAKRVTPKPVEEFLELYTSWVQRAAASGAARRPLWKQFWAVAKIQQMAERTVSALLEKDADSDSGHRRRVHADLVRLIREEYSAGVETADFLVPYAECALNQTLAALRLRNETGASVIGIYRDTESVANPPANTLLLPGDVLLIMGDKPQLEAALSYLRRKAKEPKPAA